MAGEYSTSYKRFAFSAGAADITVSLGSIASLHPITHGKPVSTERMRRVSVRAGMHHNCCQRPADDTNRIVNLHVPSLIEQRWTRENRGEPEGGLRFALLRRCLLEQPRAWPFNGIRPPCPCSHWTVQQAECIAADHRLYQSLLHCHPFVIPVHSEHAATAAQLKQRGCRAQAGYEQPQIAAGLRVSHQQHCNTATLLSAPLS